MGHGGSRAMQTGAATARVWTRTVTEGDGDEHGLCSRCWKVHKAPPSRLKAGIIAWESGVGFCLGGSAHGSVLGAA